MASSSSSSGALTIVKKRRFFDGYADINNTSRKTIVFPNHDATLNFEWKLGDLRANDREPVTVYDPQELEEHGISVNSRLLTMNGVDTSILTQQQVEELQRQQEARDGEHAKAVQRLEAQLAAQTDKLERRLEESRRLQESNDRAHAEVKQLEAAAAAADQRHASDASTIQQLEAQLAAQARTLEEMRLTKCQVRLEISMPHAGQGEENGQIRLELSLHEA